MRLIRYSYPNNRDLVQTPVYAARLRSPWGGLENEIERLFETALGDFTAPGFSDRFPVDIYEDADHTYVRAELPGVAREDIGVEFVDGYLNLNATRKTKAGEREESFSFSRSVSLDDGIDGEKISATLEHGILTVKLPKKESAKPRKIAVTVS